MPGQAVDRGNLKIMNSSPSWFDLDVSCQFKILRIQSHYTILTQNRPETNFSKRGELQSFISLDP